MDETICTATDGWFLLEPVVREGEPIAVRRIPIVAWRIGGQGAAPIPLGDRPRGDLGMLGVMHPSGMVWFQDSEYAGLRAFIDSLSRVKGPSRASSPAAETAPDRSAAAPQEQAAPVDLPPPLLLDPELAEEDWLHAAVELLNVHGHEFILHAHEWHKALALARENGWSARGTRHDAIAGWEGRYNEPHNQRVSAGDARAFADALARALAHLPPQRDEDFIQHSADSTLVALSPADYLGGVKGSRFVQALCAFAREGEFRIT